MPNTRHKLPITTWITVIAEAPGLKACLEAPGLCGNGGIWPSTVLELRSFFFPDPVACDKRSQRDQSFPPVQMPFPVQWRQRSLLSDLSP